MDAWNTRPKPWLSTLIGGLPSDSVSDATVPTTCRPHACGVQTDARLTLKTPLPLDSPRVHASD